MYAFNLNLIHLVCDRVAPIPSKPVNAGTNQEVCLKLFGKAEEFVNIALTIANVNAPLRLFKQCR